MKYPEESDRALTQRNRIMRDSSTAMRESIPSACRGDRSKADLNKQLSFYLLICEKRLTVPETHDNVHIQSADFSSQLDVWHKTEYGKAESSIALATELSFATIIGEPRLPIATYASNINGRRSL